MRTLRTISELNAALAQPRREGRRIGLVPTMGALHEGHLSLMRRAREDCDVTIVSLFVNPAQFNDSADLSAYPRDERRDALLVADQGIDFLFAPSVEEIYPAGFATTVRVTGLADVLEGAVRGRGHFEGVATVVTKLFNIVAPDAAYFGQKDAQQVLVIRHLVRDLNIPVQIEVCPIVREPDGLALSSRNVRLSPGERERALALSSSLRAAADLVDAGEIDVRNMVAVALAELDRAPVETDYFAIVEPDTLAPLIVIDGPALMLVAARIGPVRLIDNQLLSTDPTSSRPPVAAGSDTRSV